MWQQFTQPAREAVWRAQAIAVERKCAEVEGAHLFLGVIAGDDEVIATLLQVSGVAGEEARLYAASALQSEPLQPDGEPTLSPDAKRIFRLAFMESNRTHKGAIGPEHLLIACVAQQRGPHLGEVLRPLGLDAARLREHLRSLNASKTPYKRGNPLNSLTEQGKKAIEAAHAAMRASFCGQISTAHLLLGLLSDENFTSLTMLQSAGVDVEALKRRARESIVSDGQIATPQMKFSPGAKRALERAAREARATGQQFIDCGHLLVGLLPQSETWGEKWRAGGQNLDSVAELWTEEEVDALCLQLQGTPVGEAIPPVRNSKEPLPSSRFGRPWVSGLYSFALALLWDIYLFYTPHAANFWIVTWATNLLFLFIAGAIGLFLSLVLRRVPRALITVVCVLFGSLLGAVLGAYLSVAVFDKVL